MLNSLRSKGSFSNFNRNSGDLRSAFQSSLVPDSPLRGLSLKLSKSSSSKNVHVTSPKAHVGGKSQSEWADKWWKYVMETPSGSNPLTSDRTFPKFGNVQFLAGVGGSGAANRNITISPGTHLYAPLANQVVDNYGFSSAWSEQDSRITAKALMDTVKGQFFNLVSDNGETSLISEWKDYRQSSNPGGFTYTSSKDNVFSYEPGLTFKNAVQDGYYVMLNPLPPGTYTFHFGAKIDYPSVVVDQNRNGIEGDTEVEQLLDYVKKNFSLSTQDITYKVTVAPKSKLFS